MRLTDAPETRRALEDWLAPECSGGNFYEMDRSLQDLHLLYMPDDERAHMVPHFRRLGAIAGTRLDELARLADPACSAGRARCRRSSNTASSISSPSPNSD